MTMLCNNCPPNHLPLECSLFSVVVVVNRRLRRRLCRFLWRTPTGQPVPRIIIIVKKKPMTTILTSLTTRHKIQRWRSPAGSALNSELLLFLTADREKVLPCQVSRDRLFHTFKSTTWPLLKFCFSNCCDTVLTLTWWAEVTTRDFGVRGDTIIQQRCEVSVVVSVMFACNICFCEIKLVIC